MENLAPKRIFEGDRVEVFRLSSRVYFRKGDLMARGQCNSAYLVGDDWVTVVDVPTPEAAAEMEAECRALFGKPVGGIILTHGHGDHAGGIGHFAGRAVQVLCSHKLVGTIRQTGAAAKGSLVGIKGESSVILNGVHVELFTFEDIAHTPEDMFVRLPGEGILCTGDVVTDLEFLHFHSGNTRRWTENLDKLAHGPTERILPGHGDLMPFEAVPETAAHIRLLANAAQCCLAGMGAAADLDSEELDRTVSAYLNGSSAQAARIAQKAGAGAHRELRMVLREALREALH